MIGIDVGYGHVKACSGAGVISFPSAVAKSIPLQYGTGEILSINGDDFFVGEIALRERVYLLDIRNRNFILSNAWLALLSRALHQSGCKGGNLVLGIPPGHYTKALAGKVEDAVKRVSYAVKNGHVTEVSIEFQKVKAIPQGAGVFFDYVSTSSQLESNILIVDLGYQTLDIVFFEKGKYIESAAVSYDSGVSELYERILKYLSSAHGIAGQVRDVERLLSGGRLACGVDISDFIEREKKGYLNAVMQMIDNARNDLGIRVEEIVVAGGGAEILRGLLPKGYFIPENPQFSNARGYYKYAKIL